MSSSTPRRARVLFACTAAALLLLPSVALAHTVTTRDGTVYEGKIVVNNDEKIIIATTFDGRVTIPKDQVQAVDETTPPLRDQLKFRADLAKDDVQRLWDLYKWAKERGFKEELTYILMRIIELAPKNGKARKLLGHEKVDGTWMTPEEKEVYLKEKEEAEMRAKGLVRYGEEWVTPEEKDARERGLVKDGSEWVTEEEYHRRRGEQRIGGKWQRVGLDEAKAWGNELQDGRVRVQYKWYPNIDAFYDCKAEHAERVAEAAEKAMTVFRRTLRPTPQEYPEGVNGRVRMHMFLKLPAYARFAQWFDKKERCSELSQGWVSAVRRQHSFWWVDPIGVVGVYKFPNTPRTFVSNGVHNLGLILLTRYRFNYRFPPYWLQEGFAYFLEMEAMGYSETFSLSRGGTGAGPADAKPAWADSEKWRGALRTLVGEGQDPPMKRLARMRHGQMHYVELVKSWSVVECLVRYDRAKFEAFITAEKDRETSDEDALKKVYGWTWRDLDKVWRAYVARGFTHEARPPGDGKDEEK